MRRFLSAAWRLICKAAAFARRHVWPFVAGLFFLFATLAYRRQRKRADRAERRRVDEYEQILGGDAYEVERLAHKAEQAQERASNAKQRAKNWRDRYAASVPDMADLLDDYRAFGRVSERADSPGSRDRGVPGAG